MKIFSYILEFDKSISKIALGEFGENLYDFSMNLNLDHPGTKDIPIDLELSNKLCEIVHLVDYAVKNNLNLAIEEIYKFYNDKFISNNLMNLNKKFIRLLKDKSQRDEFRKCKKIQEIKLFNFYKNPRLIWDNLPEDFSIFSKDDVTYKEIIASAEEKSIRYKNVGCYGLSKNIEDSIKVVKDLVNNSYLGYREISILNASIILSKINKFNLVIDKKYFIKIKDKIYNPKLFPIHFLEQIKTDYVISLLEKLENVPLFDHYMVLVPSIKSNSVEKDILDIKENNIIPIVLGEKDGKCYFISYWI